MTDQLILEWIKETCDAYCIPKPFAIVEALEAARATAEQSEPVAWKRTYRQFSEHPIEPDPGYLVTSFHQNADYAAKHPAENVPLYAAPQPSHNRDSVIEQCAKCAETVMLESFASDSYIRQTQQNRKQISDAIRALKSQQDAAIESKPAEHITNDDVRNALAEMGLSVDDPMWSDHCEITKTSLQRWIKALRGAYYKGYAEAGYDVNERPDLVAVLKRVAKALPVLRNLLKKIGLAGVDVADELIAEVDAAIASQRSGDGS